ncbi:hypothetical protein TSOC_008335 [Tetrabaena socialis]|uniref:Uncharacterized protein n=1 Tax=Tetrabaena socialis TaxID=47790 RepID=A0A2J7ZYQ8_9CHLO|nr:hypothetical protein TSOC_008335 [Tetrabaena socialis]|eukprot:PNH05400.1 hypothetical protein TSOC_008335 [Tetrabaena socialis]
MKVGEGGRTAISKVATAVAHFGCIWAPRVTGRGSCTAAHLLLPWLHPLGRGQRGGGTAAGVWAVRGGLILLPGMPAVTLA